MRLQMQSGSYRADGDARHGLHLQCRHAKDHPLDEHMSMYP
jgi:hypothetical protein